MYGFNIWDIIVHNKNWCHSTIFFNLANPANKLNQAYIFFLVITLNT